MKFTENHIKKLKKESKIRDYKFHKKRPKEAKGRNASIKIKRQSKEKDWISWNLLYWCNSQAAELKTEVQFDKDRRWRFDWAIPSLKIAIEYEGLMSEKSGHTTITGYSANTEKYNRAQQLGWKVLRYTAINYKQLITDLNGHLTTNPA